MNSHSINPISPQRRIRYILPAALFMLSVPAAGAPPADPSEAQKKEAQALFEQASKKEDEAAASAQIGAAGQSKAQYQEAITLYERAFQTYPFPGAKFNAANCHRLVDHFATAYKQFLEAAELYAKNNKPDREQDARQKADDIKPLIPKLSIEVSADVQQLKGLHILQNGAELASSAWNTPQLLDPGEYTIEAQASSRESWAQKVHLESKAHQTVRIPMLIDPSVVSPQKKLAFVSWGIGAAGFIGWGILFGVASSTWDDAKSAAQDLPKAQDLVDSARTQARVADGFAALGIAGLAAGTILYFTAPFPRKTEGSVSIRVHPLGGLGVSGTF